MNEMTAFSKSRREANFDPKRLQKRLELAKTERRYIEPLLDEALRLYLPKRRQFYNQSRGQDQAAEIYDETGTNAIHEFASRLHAGMTPNFAKFAVLEAGPDVDEQDRPAINADLEEITDYLFDEIWASNFSQEMNEAYLDSAISVGSLLVEESASGLLTNTALPMTELYFEAGPRDEIGGMFREREVRASMLEYIYPRARFSDKLKQQIENEQDKPICVVDAILGDYSLPAGQACYSATLIPGTDPEVIQSRYDEGVGCNPFIGFRFGKIAGEVWGRGPALNTLPAVRTLNLVFELLLQNAALMMVGMYHLDDDSIVNAESITIEPGAILPRAPGTRGLEPIDMQGRHGFNLEQIIIEDGRMKVRRGLFNDMLSDPNKTPATALEVSERMADLANRMSAHFGRMHFEVIQPYMHRAMYLAQKKRRIELPTFRGQRIGVRAVSPLALAQGQRDVQGLMQYHQISTALFGPQMAAAQYEETAVLPYLRARLGAPEMVFATPERIGERFAQMMAAQLAGVQAGGAPAGPIQTT